MIMLAAGCGGGKTVYVTQSSAPPSSTTEGTPGSSVRTLTQTIDGNEQTSVVTLTAAPPEIPHLPYLESYGCSQCHLFMPGHEGYSSGSSVCFSCHKFAPSVLGQ